MPDSSALYPHIEPFDQFWLDTGDGHEIYVERSGRADGIPVLVVHGGPGGGTSPGMRRYFDPQRCHIILFDQRGCGRSRPFGRLQDNTTPRLVMDMESLRQHLGIERWILFGGSWGSTLSLLYGQILPERVLGMVLRGVFLCRREDLRWLYGEQGAASLRPEAWEAFVAPIPEAERADLITAYYQRLNNERLPQDQRQHLAECWADWEGGSASLEPSEQVRDGFRERALALACLETHYFVHGGFLPREGLLAGMERLQGVPAEIVHGRYDLVCPVAQAWALHRAWPDSHLQVVPAAGHTAAEPGIERALVQAMARLLERCA